MTTRTKRKTVHFVHPFLLKGIGRTLPAGDYDVLTGQDLIEGLSFPVYRRVSTTLIVPAAAPHPSTVEMLTVDPRELEDMLDRDEAPEPIADDATNLVLKLKPADGAL